MSIFASPRPSDDDVDVGLSVLFLHGLEGSPDGAKAMHLKKQWGARVPVIRTEALRDLRAKNPGKEWQKMPKGELDRAFEKAYSDVCAAVSYAKPDVIIGSSMGGALLAKLILEGNWEGPSVFLAPAVEPLLGDVVLPALSSSVWVLGELDTVVPNTPNIRHCIDSSGNLLISKNDCHRLHKALDSGIIDCAIVTALELDKERIVL